MLVEDYLPLQHQHQGCIPAHHAALPAVLCTLRCFLQGMMKSMDPEQLAKMMSASGMKVTPEQVGMGGWLGGGRMGHAGVVGKAQSAGACNQQLRAHPLESGATRTNAASSTLTYREGDDTTSEIPLPGRPRATPC